MIIDDVKSGLILDIIIRNLSEDEIRNLNLKKEIIENCLTTMQSEDRRSTELIEWKNQWRDHIPTLTSPLS